MSGITLDELRLYVSRCNIHKSLAPEDEENIDIDSLGTPGHRPRGLVWAARLAHRIERAMPNEFTTLFFSGLPGTGKTTEIRRLLQRLERSDGAHAFPIYIDAEQVLDIHNPIDIPDLISALVYSAEKAIATQLELREDYDPMREGYLKRLWHFLSTTEVVFDKGNFQLPKGVNLNFYMKEQPSFREQVRRTIGQHIRRFLNEASEEIQRQQARVQAKGYTGMVLILDSLEKAGGIRQNWQEVIRSIEQLFSIHAQQIELPVHTIYTVPPSVAFRLPQAGVEFMPMLKLRERDGSPCEDGVEAARQLIFRRIPRDRLALLLGPDLADDRLEQLIQWSGGYPREIVRLLYDLLISVPDEGAIPEWDFARIQHRLHDGYRLSVNGETFPLLAQVAIDNDLPAENNSQREEIDYLLRTQAVLRYQNNVSWFDLHPAIYKIPGVQEAIRRLKAAREAAARAAETPQEPS